MKFIQSINPKQLFNSKSKKSRSVSKSDPPSFSTTVSNASASSSSSSDSNHHKPHHRSSTPTSVLQKSRSQELARFVSSEFSDTSNNTTSSSHNCTNPSDVYFELVQAFKIIDRDGDGKITREELSAILTQISPEPPTEEEITVMIKEIDADNDGFITLEEFEAISSAFGPASDMEELKAVFHVFDADRDGKITAEELLKVLKSIGDSKCTLEECKKMIEGVDKNGDGIVCFEDFSRMMDLQRC